MGKRKRGSKKRSGRARRPGAGGRRPRRRTRAPKPAPLFESPVTVKLNVKPKTRKKLARASVLINVLVVALALYFAHKAGAATWFEHTGSFFSKQLDAVRSALPAFGALKTVPTPAPVKPEPAVRQPAAETRVPAPPAPVKPEIKKTAPPKAPAKKPEPVKKKTVPPPAPPKKAEPKVTTPPPPPAKPAVQKEPVKKTREISTHQPKLVFVIDDIGHTPKHRDLLVKLGDHVTYAILPHLTHSKAYGQLSRKTGAEVILHLPLESAGGTIPGPGLITDRMSTPHMLDMLSRDLQSVPYHVGVNNHMGSGGTADPDVMEPILRDLKRRNLFFLDSFTTADSVATRIGRNVGIPVLKRDVFLDNTDEQGYVRERVRELAALARRKGFAIGIGHHRHNTLQVLHEEIPKLKQEGFEILSLADLIRFQS